MEGYAVEWNAFGSDSYVCAGSNRGAFGFRDGNAIKLAGWAGPGRNATPGAGATGLLRVRERRPRERECRLAILPETVVDFARVK